MKDEKFRCQDCKNAGTLSLMAEEEDLFVHSVKVTSGDFSDLRLLLVGTQLRKCCACGEYVMIDARQCIIKDQ